MKLFNQRLKPVCQMFPSLWSRRMNVFLQMFLKQVNNEIEHELVKKYELINGEFDLMNEEINVEQIDKGLAELLKDPSKYAKKKELLTTLKKC